MFAAFAFDIFDRVLKDSMRILISFYVSTISHALYVCTVSRLCSTEQQSICYAVHTVGACMIRLFNMKVTWCRCVYVYIMITASAWHLLSVRLILITFALSQKRDLIWLRSNDCECVRMCVCTLCRMNDSVHCTSAWG